MFDLKELKKAADQIAKEKGIDANQVLEAIESSIAAAYKKEYGKRGEIIRSEFDIDNGQLKFWQVKTVVDETTARMDGDEEEYPPSRFEEEEGKLPRYNPDRHILLDEAKKLKSDAVLGEEFTFPLDIHEDFGRIAAQTAKQVILQRLREAERDSILREFKDRADQIVSGTVQRFERGNLHVDLGRAMGIMFANESIPGEHYRIGERLRFYVLAVQEDSRLPGIILSRANPKFVSKLFELEVPEISEGIIEIKGIAREPGSRTKIAVASKSENIDPVGSCVGQRGTRVMAVNNELGQEKLDIIEWSDDAEKFVANSLSPAKVESVEILPRREARVYVPDDQLSLAIGRGGQNVRLAAKLTNLKIDVRPQSNPETVQEGGIAEPIAPNVEGVDEAGEEKNKEPKKESSED